MGKIVSTGEMFIKSYSANGDGTWNNLWTDSILEGYTSQPALCIWKYKMTVIEHFRDNVKNLCQVRLGDAHQC